LRILRTVLRPTFTSLSRHLAPARILARHTRNRIQGALLNLEITTRGRRIPSSVFLKAHWPAVAASDFFTVEAWSWTGLVTHYVLDLATRRVSLCGITTHPKEAWMMQIARNLLDSETGALRGKRHLIVDRDTKYSTEFRTFLAREGVQVIRLPPRSPNLNAYAERIIRSVRDECLSKLIPIGAPMLRRALREYLSRYHLERNHLLAAASKPLRLSGLKIAYSFGTQAGISPRQRCQQMDRCDLQAHEVDLRP
jgi:transposase InsO family protein